MFTNKIYKKILFCLITSVASIAAQTQTLELFKHRGASVLPMYTYQGEKWVLLSREAGGPDKGTYDDFGGARDRGEDPLTTAARECAEELITQSTIGKDVDAMIAYITLNAGNTQHVIAQHKAGRGSNYVTYITRFDKQIDAIRKNFYPARKKSWLWKYREKDRLAFVRWNTIKSAIQNSKRGQRLTVEALVIDPKTNELQTKKIKLRPIFADKLRSFFQDKPYKSGTNKKVRFYT